MRRFLSIVAVYLSIVAVAAVAANLSDPDPSGRGAAGEPDDEIVLAAALQQFDDCDQLLQYFREAALERVGPYGLDGGMWDLRGGGIVLEDGAVALEGGGAPAPMGGAAAGSGAAAGGDAMEAPAEARVAENTAKDSDAFSGTNVQEVGVDEPDIVKTDGRRVVVLNAGRLHVLISDGDELRRVGSLRLPDEGGQEMLLDGDRLLVLGHRFDDVMPLVDDMARSSMPVGGGGTTSTFTMVDISDPTDPTVTSTMEVDGNYLSARLVDGVARVVLRSQPSELPFTYPEAGGLRSERNARQHNREVIEESTVDQWLPYAVMSGSGGGETEAPLLECDAVHHPEEFAGFGLVSVLSVDLAGDISAAGSAAVVGDSDTVYASPENLYVAVNRWGQQPWDLGRPVAPDEARTELHQFDIADPAQARYVASGAVKGRLLNQWALSEHDGHLRVATTREGLGDGSGSESGIVVLRTRDQELERVGRIDGLGKGEQIYSVRYIGDVAYLVTFRQTDPLYTVDLSNPREPQVRGELKIPGYSAYLHPVDDDRLLGVGQDADETGQVLGSQVSLFDVGNLSNPQRVDQVKLGQGSSPVEYDHRAFLYWPETGTIVLPLQTWDAEPFMGAQVMEVNGNQIRRVGRISHGATTASKAGVGAPEEYLYGGSIVRALVIGDELLTVSDLGVMAHDMASLEPHGEVRFDRNRD